MSAKLESLRLKLKAETKLKLFKERLLLKLRNVERSYSEDLHTTRSEIEYLTEQLEDLKDKISETNHEIARIEIQKSAEKSKFDTRVSYLNLHRKGFQQQFDRENTSSELRARELEEREASEQELLRLRRQQVERANEQQAREAAAIGEQADALERECAVLKKRNNAIMLKLRRKLVETEEARRELMKQHSGNHSSK